MVYGTSNGPQNDVGNYLGPCSTEGDELQSKLLKGGLYNLGVRVYIVSKLLEGDFLGYYIEILSFRVLGLGFLGLGCCVLGVGVSDFRVCGLGL